jgi:hypothetical protein
MPAPQYLYQTVKKHLQGLKKPNFMDEGKKKRQIIQRSSFINLAWSHKRNTNNWRKNNKKFVYGQWFKRRIARKAQIIIILAIFADATQGVGSQHNTSI